MVSELVRTMHTPQEFVLFKTCRTCTEASTKQMSHCQVDMSALTTPSLGCFCILILGFPDALRLARQSAAPGGYMLDEYGCRQVFHHLHRLHTQASCSKYLLKGKPLRSSALMTH